MVLNRATHHNYPIAWFQDVQTLSPSTLSPGTIPLTFQDRVKLNAEIRWELKHVVRGHNDNFATGSVDVLKAMFADSKFPSIKDLGN